MNITWLRDPSGSDGPFPFFMTEAIPAFPEDATLPDEHFILRTRHQGEGKTAWMVDYHEDLVSAPHESIESGLADTLEGAQREAIRALLNIEIRPAKFGWASVPATVYVRVDMLGRLVDRVVIAPHQQPVHPFGAGETIGQAHKTPLTDMEGEDLVVISDEDNWSPLEFLPDSVTWDAG